MPNKNKLVWSLCQMCKRPYQVRATELRRGRYTCGGQCAVYARSYSNIGREGLYASRNGNWKGGIVKHCKGYIYQYAPHHPRQWNGYVLQHILVAEDKLGRYLLPGEVVHHHNGNKADNRAENITVFSSPGEHSKYHHKIRKEVQYAN